MGMKNKTTTVATRKISIASAVASRLRTRIAVRKVRPRVKTRAGIAIRNTKVKTDQGSIGSPRRQPKAEASVPASWTRSIIAVSGSQLIAKRPRKRPDTSSRLVHGRLSSTSAMRSRWSRARTSKARKIKPTRNTRIPQNASPDIR